MLKIMGVGMPRTGTASLCEALQILGFNAIHHEPERIDLDAVKKDSLRVYDDVDAVVDMPAAYFHHELTSIYHVPTLILTGRDTNTWWESIKAHTNQIHVSANQAHIRYTDQLHTLLFGTAFPHEYLWKRAYNLWNLRLARQGAACLDISAGDKWDVLCSFLGVPEPDAEFPWENRRG